MYSSLEWAQLTDTVTLTLMTAPSVFPAVEILSYGGKSSSYRASPPIQSIQPKLKGMDVGDRTDRI